MYAHYTSAFVLAAQLAWVIWAHRDVWKPALLANAAAAIAFIPWIPSTLADLDSPTTDILSALQGDGFTVKRTAVELWAVGAPGARLDQVPGEIVLKVVFAALAIAGLVALWTWFRRIPRPEGGSETVQAGVVLVLALALATPVCEAAILLLGGDDLFGARNLNTSSGGLALAIGAVLATPTGLLAAALTTTVIGCFGIAAVRGLDDRASTVNFKSPAAVIDDEAQSDDVVLDTVSSALSPVPLTPLQAHLSEDHSLVTLYLPTGPAPFLLPPPPPGPQIQQAFDAAGPDGRVFAMVRKDAIVENGDHLELTVFPPNPNAGPTEVFELPAGTEIVQEETYAGLGDVSLLVLEPGDGRVKPIT